MVVAHLRASQGEQGRPPPREPALLVLFSLPLVQTHASGLLPVPAVDFDDEKARLPHVDVAAPELMGREAIA